MNGNRDDTEAGCGKIPWNDPEFSRRMLAEHLSQEHDLASRRSSWIDQQVEWIHRRLLGERKSAILDLGCGPGLYCHRLAGRGHHCLGVDFSPASIEYARQHRPLDTDCRFQLADIRELTCEGSFDLAMILFGEFNTFSPDEALAMLQGVRSLLDAGGRLVIELQTAEAVEQTGKAESSSRHYASGLFSDSPYQCRTESGWHADRRLALQTFHVTDSATGQTRLYHNSAWAWPREEFTELLSTAGFSTAAAEAGWPGPAADMELWLAS